MAVAVTEALRRYVEASRAPNTLRAYDSDLRHYQRWCHAHQMSWLPAEPETVAGYLASLAVAAIKPSTVRRRLSAIAEATSPRLIQRFPTEIYWSDLLPLTWATVGDVGVRQLADQVAEAYAHSKYVATAWEATDDDQMRRYIWNSTFPIFIAPRALHALAIVHEVVEDLQRYARAEAL